MDKLTFTILLHELAGGLKRHHDLFGYAALETWSRASGIADV